MSMLSDQQSGGGFFASNPKTMFFMGLFVGISSVTTIALALVVGMMVSGKGFGVAVAAGQQVAAAPSPSVAPTPSAVPEPTPSAPVKPVDEKTEYVRGPKNAKVTLIEYSDFECPFCLRHVPTIEQVMKEYPNDVRLVYRHFPLSFHPEAQKAAEAAECAGAQGKFWEMHDKIFDANKAGKMSVETWKATAKELGLNTAKFDKCLDGGEMAGKIAKDQQEGADAGVQGTPATYVNGVLVEGAVPFSTFKTKIDALLKS